MEKETLFKVALVTACAIGTVLAFGLLVRAAWIGVSGLIGLAG